MTAAQVIGLRSRMPLTQETWPLAPGIRPPGRPVTRRPKPGTPLWLRMTGEWRQPVAVAPDRPMDPEACPVEWIAKNNGTPVWVVRPSAIRLRDVAS